MSCTGGNVPTDGEEGGGTPRGAAEQVVLQARMAVVTALNTESKEAALTPAAQYYIKVCAAGRHLANQDHSMLESPPPPPRGCRQSCAPYNPPVLWHGLSQSCGGACKCRDTL